MSLIVSVLFVLMIMVFILEKNFSGLITLILLSLLGNMFFFNFFGSRIIIFQLISLLYFPFIIKYMPSKKILSIISGIKLEYILLILLGVLYGFIIPWDDNSTVRAWNQIASGKAIVALVNIFSNILLVYLTIFLFLKNRVHLIKFLNILSVLVIIISVTAFLDKFFNYPIYKLFFGGNSITPHIKGRLLGFSHEPRALGRMMVQIWVYLFIYKTHGFKFKYSNLSLIMGFLVILFSFSFSSYFIFLLSIIIFFKKNIFKIKLTSLLVISLGLYLCSIFILKNDIVKNSFLYKYKITTEGRGESSQMHGEPKIFTQFEIFDRAALNFLYRNPEFLFFGTGPNLISIPASKYVSDDSKETMSGLIVGIPNSSIINLISRSGIIGLFLYLIVFIKVYRYLGENKLLKNLFIIVVANFIFVNTSWIYFSIGFVLAQQFNTNLNNKIKC